MESELRSRVCGDVVGLNDSAELFGGNKFNHAVLI